MAIKTDLRLIDRSDANRGQLYAALDIYRDAVRPEEQNPEKQILYWIDHRDDLKADEFRCFTITRGSDVIGYLQYSYFNEERIFFLEYLCVKRSGKPGLAPDQGMIAAIRRHLIENYEPGFMIVFEVAHEKTNKGTRVSDSRRLDYFGRLGFRKIDYPYRYPILQTYDGEISYPADLMVSLPNRRKILTSAELRTILRCLYFKHYLRWDRPFLDKPQFEQRQRLIDDLYAIQLTKIGNQETFNTDGDDKRLGIFSFDKYQPRVRALLAKLFGPKLPRLLIIIAVLLLLERTLKSVWVLIPFAIAVAIIYCLAEDTETSVKILSIVMSKMSLDRQRE